MFEKFYDIVKSIPKGRVASYGFVAKTAGYPKCSRQVGWALHQNPSPQSIPCHRVVTKGGKLSAAFAFGGENIQAKLLENEGVEVKNGMVNMKKFSLDYLIPNEF